MATSSSHGRLPSPSGEWNRGPAAVNQHLFKVVAKPGVDRDFLKFRIEHDIEPLADRSHGSTMRHIKRSVIKRFRVVLPPLPEQRKIAAILTSVDDAIAATEAVDRADASGEGGTAPGPSDEGGRAHPVSGDADWADARVVGGGASGGGVRADHRWHSSVREDVEQRHGSLPVRVHASVTA